MKRNCKSGVIFALLILLSVFLTSCDWNDFRFFYVSGYVYDSTTHQSLRGVRIGGPGSVTIYSDSQGEFHGTFPLPRWNSVRITFRREGYETHEYVLYGLQPGETRTLVVPMEKIVPHTAQAHGSIYYTGIQENTIDGSANKPAPAPAAKMMPRADLNYHYTGEYHPSRVLVTLREGLSVQETSDIHVRMGTRPVKKIERANLHVVEIKEGMTIEETIALYEGQPEVLYCEPDYRLYPLATTPNDPEYQWQWGLDMIQMPYAWEISTGHKNVLVGVIDTGIVPHPDLFPNSGYDWGNIRWDKAYDFINEDEEPFDLDADHINQSHGTHVAGIIGALTDNGLGIAGIAWDVGIVPLRVIGDDSEGYTDNLIEAIYYAEDNGIDIVNISLGTENTIGLEQACRRARFSGVTLVAAAGNSVGGNTDVVYPAAYDEVIAVGAVGDDGKKASYSSYGYGLDFVAPGGDNDYNKGSIISTTGYFDNTSGTFITDYFYSEGTSLAAAHVSGVAALLKASDVTLTPDDIYDRLLASTPGNRWQAHLGYGLIDAYRALYTPPKPPSPLQIFAGRFHGDRLVPYSKIVEVAYGEKNYRLTGIEPGSYNIFLWADNNNDGDINYGDYFYCSYELEFRSGDDKRVDLYPQFFDGFQILDTDFTTIEVSVQEKPSDIED